jgi:glycerophosphoryl diester phosphodiesterase
MWEVDIRLTSDGVPVAFHDADLAKVCGLDARIGEVSAARLADLTAAAGRPAPRFEEVAALAARCGAGIYLDAKEGEAATKAIDILLRHRVEQVIVGANTPELLRRPDRAWVALSGVDPRRVWHRSLSRWRTPGGAGIVHPCWERAGDRPDALLDAAFFAEANRRGLPVVTWHEERADVIEALVRVPVLGICSDQPEMVARHRRRPPVRSGDRLSPWRLPDHAGKHPGGGEGRLVGRLRDCRDRRPRDRRRSFGGPPRCRPRPHHHRRRAGRR